MVNYASTARVCSNRYARASPVKSGDSCNEYDKLQGEMCDGHNMAGGSDTAKETPEIETCTALH